MDTLQATYLLFLITTNQLVCCALPTFHFLSVYTATYIPANSCTGIMRDSHACGSKTLITCIRDNFSRLTHNSRLLVH